MDFSSIYRQAMEQRAPALYKELWAAGALEAHVFDAARDARRHLDALIDVNGFHDDMNGRRMVEEIALQEQLDSITPSRDKPTRAALDQFAALTAGARAIDVSDDEEEFVDDEQELSEQEDDEQEDDDLDEEAAAEILAEFEGGLPATDALENYIESTRVTPRPWLGGVDDIDEAEAIRFLKDLEMLAATATGDRPRLPAPPARGPRMEIQYRYLRARWQKDPRSS